MYIKNRSLAYIATVTFALLATTACNTNFSKDASEPTDGTGNDLEAINSSIEGNLYVEALEQRGEGSNTCPVTKDPDEKLDLVFSIEGLSHPSLSAQVEAAKAAGDEVNAEVTVLSGEDDVNTQLSGLETTLSQQPDGLLLMPAKTQGLQPILQSYADQDIPYAFTGKGMTGVDPATQVLAPYGEEGKILGEYVVEHYEEETEPVRVAVITGITGDLSSVARVGTFKKALAESGEFEFVAEQPGEYRRQPSQDAMDSILAAHPDVQLVFAASDDGALGAIDAIKSAGKTGQIDVVGIDGLPEMFAAIERGEALATVTHLPSAGLATELLARCIRGEQVPEFEGMVGELVDKAAIREGAAPAF